MSYYPPFLLLDCPYIGENPIWNSWAKALILKQNLAPHEPMNIPAIHRIICLNT